MFKIYDGNCIMMNLNSEIYSFYDIFLRTISVIFHLIEEFYYILS